MISELLKDNNNTNSNIIKINGYSAIPRLESPETITLTDNEGKLQVSLSCKGHNCSACPIRDTGLCEEVIEETLKSINLEK